MSRWLVSLVICCVGLRQGQDRSYEAAALRRKHTTKTTSEHTPRPWEYWSLCEGSLSCPPQQRYGIEDADAQAEKQFLIVNSWGAGFNNERDSLEIGFALAYAWNRTLVLPPYLGNPPSGDALWAVNETWDVEAMKEVVSAGTRHVSAETNATTIPCQIEDHFVSHAFLNSFTFVAKTDF